MANDGKGNGQTVSTRKEKFRKAQKNTSSQGQGPSNTIGPDKDGFIPTQNHAKGKGQKLSHLDWKVDLGFNQFEVLDNMVIEEGILVEAQCGHTCWIQLSNCVLSLMLQKYHISC